MTPARRQAPGLKAAGLAALAAAALSGCIATQRDVLDLEQQTDEVKASVADLKKSLTGMQANQADLAVKLDVMHKDVSVLTETLKDSQDSMRRLSSKMDDLDAKLGQRVSALGDTLNRQQQAQLASQQATQQAAQHAAERADAAQEAVKKATEAPPPVAGPTPSQVYNTAQVQLSKKEYDLAAEGFGLYLKRNPKGEVADLATYYLGDALFGAKRWEEAAGQYALALDRFPKSDITPSARLKYAMALLKLKTHQAEAKRYLQSIPDDFPKSPEAASALKLLQKLEPPVPAARVKSR